MVIGGPARPPGLLIVEASAARLRREGNSRMVDELRESLRASERSNGLRVLRYEVNSLADLEFGRALAKEGKYDGVLVVGHGGPDGRIEAAPGVPIPWEAAGQALAPLCPRVVLAVSCFAGAARPTRALFDTIPTLEAVMGSPLPLTTRQAQLATFELLARVHRLPVQAELSIFMTIVNAGLTGGVVWTRTRDDIEKKTDADLAAEDSLAAMAKVFLGLSGTRRLKGRTRRATRRGAPSRRTAVAY